MSRSPFLLHLMMITVAGSRALGLQSRMYRMQAMHKDINQNGVKGNKFSINLLPILCVCPADSPPPTTTQHHQTQ